MHRQFALGSVVSFLSFPILFLSIEIESFESGVSLALSNVSEEITLSLLLL